MPETDRDAAPDASVAAAPAAAGAPAVERKPAGRKSSEERREEILRATLGIVARKGFASVTLREVAAEVGVVHGLIRHYFATREELMAVAFDRAATAELAADSALLASLEPVRALAAWLATTPEDHYLVWIDAWSEAPRNPALAATLVRHHHACEALLAGVIRRVVDVGLATSADPDEDARMLTALADGVAVQHHAMGVVDAPAADALVFTATEQRLGMTPGSLAAVLADAGAGTGAARGRWAD